MEIIPKFVHRDLKKAIWQFTLTLIGYFVFFSAYRRYKKYRHKHRESLPCNDKFDKTFRNWLLFSGRTKERAIKNLENLNKTKGQKYIFKNRRQVNKFVQKLENEIKQK